MTGTLHPQLQEIAKQIDDATRRAAQMAASVGESAFAQRPAEGAWSAAECIGHLNLTTKAFLPLIDQALAGTTRGTVDPGVRYRRDPIGWFLSWMMEPPFRVKMKTTAPFVPDASAGRDVLMREFETLQGQLAKRVEAASGYDVSRIKVTSPFEARMRYNLLSGFTAILAHERRHLWQAERAAMKR